MSDLRVPLDPIFEAFGIPAQVTPPAPHEPVAEASAVWHTPLTSQAPVGLDVQHSDHRRVLALRRDEVPAVPRGTRIVAAEVEGGDVAGWVVDGFDRFDPEIHLLVVVRDPEYVA